MMGNDYGLGGLLGNSSPYAQPPSAFIDPALYQAMVQQAAQAANQAQGANKPNPVLLLLK